MRAYLAVISAKFRMLLQYRASAIGGAVTQAFFGLIMIMAMEGFYSSTTNRQPIGLSQIVAYLWLGQAFLGMLPWNADAEVRRIIRSGAVAYELLRPVDLYNLWFSRAMATRTAPVLLRAVPIFVFSMVVLPRVGLGGWAVHAPATGSAAGTWLAAMGGALLLSVSRCWSTSLSCGAWAATE